MKRMLILLAAALPLGGCADYYGGGYYGGGGYYAGAPIGYDGFYDGYYGSIYDGYWGTDGGFYYRRGYADRRFRRGGPDHFRRGPGGGDRFQPMRGNFTPGPGMRTPHFGGPPGGGPRGGPGGFHGGGRGGHGH